MLGHHRRRVRGFRGGCGPLYAWVLWRLRRRLHLDELVGAFGSGPRARPGRGRRWTSPPAGRSSSVPSRRVRPLVRIWCMATAPLRRPPDILVLGTKRGGSTSLAAYLYAHPQVLPPVPARLAPKGVRAFDEHPDRGRWWYRSHFATVFVRGTARRRATVRRRLDRQLSVPLEQAARAVGDGPGGARRGLAARSGRARVVALARADPSRAGDAVVRGRVGRRGRAVADAARPRSGQTSRTERRVATPRCFPPGRRRSVIDCSCLFAEEMFADPGADLRARGGVSRAAAVRDRELRGMEPASVARLTMDPGTRAPSRVSTPRSMTVSPSCWVASFRGVLRRQGFPPSAGG